MNLYDIRGLGNRILKVDGPGNTPSVGDRIPGVEIHIVGDNNTIRIGRNLQVTGELNMLIKGNHIDITLGDNLIIQRSVRFVFVPQFGSRPDHSSIHIGDDCIFNGADIALEFGEMDTHIRIGKNCLFAGQIKLSTTDNHKIFDVDTRERLNRPGDIVIGDHCWICEGVTMLNHSEVSANSVVGTRSVVNKRFLEPNLLIAGIPARVCRKNIDWDRRID